MEDGSPTLEIGFAIETGSSFDQLVQLQQVMNSAEAKIVREAANIERATGGMVKLGPATASITSYANAATRDLANVNREKARAEKVGEGLIRQLEREASTFGKTRDEIRAMKVEAAALAAEQVGNTDLATRLRAQEQALYDQKFAAMRQARFEAEALAEAEQRAAAQQAAAQLAAASASERAAREHAALAAAVRASHAAQEADAAAAERLRMATDPLYAATSRLNAEIAESTRLYHAGVTAPVEYARQQEVLAARLRAVGEANDAHSASMRRGTGTLTQFSFQLNDVITMAASGAPVMQIVATQAGQIFQIAQMAEGGVKGFAAQLGGLAVAYAPVIAVAAAAVGGFALFNRAITSDIDTKPMIDSLGLTRAEIKRLKDTSVGAGDTITATFQVLMERVGLNLGGVKTFFADAMDFMTTVGRQALAGIYAMFAGTFGAISSLVENLKDGDFANMLSDAGNAYAGAFQDANTALTQFGEDVEAQVRSNKLADLQKQAAALKADRTSKAESERLKLAKARAEFDADTSGLERQFELISAGMKAEEARFRVQQAAAGILEDAIERRIVAEQRLNDIIAQRNFDDENAALEQQYRLVVRGYAIEEARFRVEQMRAGVTVEQIEQRLLREQAINDALANREEVIKRISNIAVDDPGLAKLFDFGRITADFSDEWNRANERVEKFLNLTAQIDLDGVFGRAGKSLASMVNTFDELLKRQAAYGNALADARKLGLSEEAVRRKHVRLQIGDLGTLAGASKEFFNERSKGYKILSTAEQAFRAIELAMSIRAMAQNAIETATKLASRTAGAAAAGTEAIAVTGASLPFPFNLGAMGVMAAALASIGIITGFSGGKGQKPTYNAGKGTVFGDKDAESQSIARGLELLTDIEDQTLTYTGQMLASLRNIEANIGGLANLIVRTGGVEASGAGIKTGFDRNGLGDAIAKQFDPFGRLLGINIPILSGLARGIGNLLGGLFGTKTSIVGQGISADAQSLSSILGSGFDADYFTDLKKKKKTFGITSSTKYSTQTTAADAELERQFGLIFKDFNDAISAAAGPLGTSLGEVQQRLSGFVVDIGKINLKGLTGEQIQEKLSAVFGAAGDRMAKAAMPGLEKFQRVGEGYFETMVRVSSTVEAMNSSFAMLGQSARLGVEGAMSLVSMFGDLGTAQQAAADYFSAFYTDAEQTAARTNQLRQAMAGLGFSMPTTAAGFRQLVEAQNLNTEAGRQSYASLMKLAPMFSEVFGTAEEAAQAAADAAAEAAERANAIAEERLGLESRLLQIQGNTAELRARELASLDPSNRALQQHIWALEDQAAATADAQRALEEAARAAQAVANERAGLERRILELQGNTAAIRARELTALDASNRGLQQYIWALEDQAAAIAEAQRVAAEAAQRAEAIANERVSLENRLLDVQGNTAAIRARELAALDPANRALQQHIWALEDATAAAAEAAQRQEAITNERLGLERQLLEAQGNTAAIRALELAALAESNRALQLHIWALQDQAAAVAEAERVASEAAARVEAVANERAGLERQLLQTQGDTVAIRGLELAALDASNRAIQLQIWALEDQAAATAEAERVAAEAAQRQEAIANERLGLERQLLELNGDTAAIRALELAALDESNRALQMQIWALEQQKAAQEEATRAAEELKNAWTSIADGLLEEAKRIRGALGGESGSYATLLARFNDATALARAGDQDAAKQLTGLSQSLLSAADAAATDSAFLARIQGRIASSLEETAALGGGGTTSTADVAALVSGASSSGKPAWWESFVSGQMSDAQQPANDSEIAIELRTNRAEMSELRAELQLALATIAGNTGKVARALDRVMPDGDAIQTREAAA